MLGSVVLLGLALSGIDALRFAHNPVVVDTDVIIVGRPATLTCNYVKMRAETIREISWYAGYTGFRSKIFHFSTSTGQKEGSVYPFIKTDVGTATDDKLTITLTEFRDANMTFACEVESLRDDGYGKLRHNKKLGEAFIGVVNDANHELLMKTDPDMSGSVAMDKALMVTCVSRGANPPPRLSILFDRKNVTELYGGRLKTISSRDVDEVGVEGSLQRVPMGLFSNDLLTIECVAQYDDFIFARKELVLRKKDGEDNYNSGYGRPGQYNSNRRSWDDTSSQHDDHSTTTRRDEPWQTTGYDASGANRDGHRQGRVGDGYNADVSRLMDMMDPARHVHPGIPYDFFAGYLIMIADSMNTVSPNNDNDYGHVTLFGELPYDVETSLSRNYGRVNKISGDTTRVRMAPATVLNTLASMGYRVASSARAGNDGFMWTLERKRFGNEEL